MAEIRNVHCSQKKYDESDCLKIITAWTNLAWQMPWCEITALENTAEVEAELLGIVGGYKRMNLGQGLGLYLLDVKMMPWDLTHVQLLPM